jgi:hypothetical protein
MSSIPETSFEISIMLPVSEVEDINQRTIYLFLPSESTTSSTEFGERGQNCDQQCPKPFHLFAVIAAGR